MDQGQLKQWLMDKCNTPSGTERKNNPFGPLEQEVLNDFNRAVLDEDGVYRVYDNRGNYFGYEYQLGKISIIDISYNNMAIRKPIEAVVEELLSRNFTSHEYYFDHHTELAPDRKRLHQQIIGDILSRQPYSQNRRVYMLGGGPANGKSSLIKSGLLPHPENALKIDVDEIKLMLPEYQYMLTKRESLAAPIVHVESANIGHDLRSYALESGYDIVWDGIANESLEHRMEAALELKSYGHHCRVDYVTLDMALSLELAELRYQRTGRRVPESVIKEKNRSVAELVPQLIKHQVFDELYLWDTNIHNQPRLILSQKNGKLEVADQALYNNFKMKAHVKAITQTPKQGHKNRKRSHRL